MLITVIKGKALSDRHTVDHSKCHTTELLLLMYKAFSIFTISQIHNFFSADTTTRILSKLQTFHPRPAGWPKFHVSYGGKSNLL